MDHTESESGDSAARKDHIHMSAATSGARPRGADRREDGGIFGPYQGPERRSGRDRRDSAPA